MKALIILGVILFLGIQVYHIVQDATQAGIYDWNMLFFIIGFVVLMWIIQFLPIDLFFI